MVSLLGADPGMATMDFARTRPSTTVTPVVTCDLGSPLSAVAACPASGFERCIAAGGTDHLSLLAARATVDGSLSLRPLPVELTHAGPLDALAWGHDVDHSILNLVAAGPGSLVVHRLPMAVSDVTTTALTGTGAAGRVRSACLMHAQPLVAVAGDGCACVVRPLDASQPVTRTYLLGSPGVAVRAHPSEPEQLLVAQEDGQLHFLDLRTPANRPALSRSLPPGDSDAGGLRDADW